jgi:hypothetical protein
MPGDILLFFSASGYTQKNGSTNLFSLLFKLQVFFAASKLAAQNQPFTRMFSFFKLHFFLSFKTYTNNGCAS